MLVLTRKLGEQIQISDGELTVTVVAIEGSRVRLGISAPPAVAIARQDCRHRMNAQALVSPPKSDNRGLRPAECDGPNSILAARRPDRLRVSHRL
jgi:carbon storage regulator